MIRITFLKSTWRPKRIGQSALFHDLEEHVEDVGVRLLDFVEQNHRVGRRRIRSVS